MTNNIYDTANQLERDMRTLPAFIRLTEAFSEIKANEESNALFESFKTATQAFQMKQMTGGAPTEEEIAHLQELSAKASQDAAITKLMESEQQLSQIINDINRIITKPLQDLYQA
ncbi:MAG: YlbF family regulator [Aerococcaceae bacterium]|nr:YlbF family regulator [Aerococcaceae bacterium]